MTRQTLARIVPAGLLVGSLAGSVTLMAQKGTRPQAAPPAPTRIQALVAQMTLDEKVGMLHGATDPGSRGQAGYLPGVPRLGIPPLRLTDGPAGVRVTEAATALPAPVSLASTFSTALATQYGRIIGRDARAHAQNVVLAPMVNLVRAPQGGRNFETLGEDPLLASRLVAAEVKGMQGEGVIATVKHYAFNNQENGRTSDSSEVDEQTGREMELAGFEAAIKAGVGSVMASYNKVNGAWAAENVPLLTGILRKEWGFTGFVMSDWGATHSAVPALSSGMEMEMPSGRHFAALAGLVKKGEIDEKVVDEAVIRILTAMDAAGLLGPAARPVPPIPAVDPAARDLAVAGAVLLKNEGNVLPLTASDLQSTVVLGPTAKILLIGGGGSAAVRPMHNGSPVDALTAHAGSAARITYVKGYDVDGELVPAGALEPRTTIDVVGDKALPPGSTYVWSGTITGATTGDYVLKVQTSGGRATLVYGPEAAAQSGQRGGRGGTATPAPLQPPDVPGFGAAALLQTADGFTNTSFLVHLEGGAATPLTITAGPGRTGRPVQARLCWVTPDLQRARIAEAVAAARAARVAVVFAYDEGTEGRDRTSLSMPGIQDQVVAAVAAANPRTVVVLNNGAPVTMPWAGQVAAILQMWYPGQEGADATAALLLGEASPGGRLPVTFPKRAEDAPTARPERYPGVNGQEAYSEGIFAGYRWYDRENIEPLFPFGHGLTYSTFAYSGLAVKPAGRGYDVTLVVKNTGTREAEEVPQVYLGPPPQAPAPMAVKKLVGFDRVSIAPGASKTVTIHVDAEGLSYWSTATHRRMVAGGRRAFMVGASSRDIRLKAEVNVPPGK